MKLKADKRTLIVAGIAVLVVFGLMASRSDDEGSPQGSLDAAAQQACSDFAAGYPDAETKPERLALADKVMTSSRRTDNEPIADRAQEMGLAASDGGTAWENSADALRDACRAAGWVAP